MNPWLTSLFRFSVVLMVWNLFSNGASADPGFQQQRQRMVKEIRAMGIRDPRALEVMGKVPRHLFVPTGLRSFAYLNEPLAIGSGQTISQPYVVAFMTEALQLKPTDKVLEVGTGSGYQAAVLSELVDSVFTIEIVEGLGKLAAEVLESNGYHNLKARIGDGYHGWPEEAPFDAIIVTAAAPAIPKPLVQQLKDGGRLILPVGNRQQELVLLSKQGDNIKKSNVLAVAFVSMTGPMRAKDE